MIDFVKLKMWVFEAIAAAEADFCEGYGSDPIATNEGRLSTAPDWDSSCSPV
jgi:hypothetical protein